MVNDQAKWYHGLMNITLEEEQSSLKLENGSIHVPLWKPTEKVLATWPMTPNISDQ